MSRNDLDPILLQSESAEEFLKQAFNFLKSNRHGFSYNVFARKAGLSSPSSVRQVIQGQKRVTLKIFPGFCRALELTPISQEYLKYLLALESTDFNERNLSSDDLKKSLTNLKRKLQSIKSNEEINLNALRQHPHRAKYPTVYAALGGSDGCSLEEILTRIQVSEDIVVSLLETLVQAGIVNHNQDTGNYTAQHEVVYTKILKEREFLKEYFLHEMAEISAKARQNFDSENELFFVSTFSIHADQMPALKKELIQTLVKFGTNAIADDGATVVKFACGFIHN